MNIIVRKYEESDIEKMVEIWNEVVEDGEAFPQTELLNSKSGKDFFDSQTTCSVAVDTDTKNLLGLYILHPNNVGRCGHISNASYAVKKGLRGLHIGEKLVLDSINQAKENGFRILQFNAVVKSNLPARKLYEKLGFTPLGTIPGGFLNKDGGYVDIVPYFIKVKS